MLLFLLLIPVGVSGVTLILSIFLIPVIIYNVVEKYSMLDFLETIELYE